jgi:hypothetical protein
MFAGRALWAILAPFASDPVHDIRTGDLERWTFIDGSARERASILREQSASGSADVPSDSRTAPAVVVPASLAYSTVEAMVRFASRRSIAGAVSSACLSLTVHTLRTLQMTRLAIISALLILVVAATGTAIFAGPRQVPAPTRPIAATDRLGNFRLSGLPDGPLRLGLRSNNHDQHGWARRPGEAVEVDLIFPP